MLRKLMTVLAGLLTAISSVAQAEAQVGRIEILSREAPASGGGSFGRAGRYEKIEGRVHGEVDPGDPRNAIITDSGWPRGTPPVRSSTRRISSS